MLHLICLILVPLDLPNMVSTLSLGVAVQPCSRVAVQPCSRAAVQPYSRVAVQLLETYPELNTDYLQDHPAGHKEDWGLGGGEE